MARTPTQGGVILRIDQDNFLVNGAGQYVLGEAGRIALQPYSEIEIGGDGTISIQRLGALPNALAASRSIAAWSA